jgi:hypothetical protein
MLPDRASPDRSREAGLNDKAEGMHRRASNNLAPFPSASEKEPNHVKTDLVEHVDGIVREEQL